MGLAASQARFLAITSRKMNCEFQSMQLAQQKLSITRDLQKASQDYQYALDASKLVWEDENGDTYNLSYDLMMTPSALNEYDPYLLTDTKGRIVLSNAMFNAAVNAGVVDKEGNPKGKYKCGDANSKTDGSRNALLYQLGVNNAASADVIKSIVDIDPKKGYTKSGVGGPIFDKSVAKIMDTNTFINQYLKTETIAFDSDELKFSICTDALASALGTTKADLGTKYYSGEGITDGSNDGKFQIRDASGNIISYDTVKSLTLGDLISGQYTLSIIGGTVGITNVFNAILKPLYDPNDGAATNYPSRNDLLITDKESYDAATEAMKWFEKFCTKKVSESTTYGSNFILAQSARAATANNIRNNLTGVGVGGTSFSCQTISISNMLKSYLTCYAAMMDGFGSQLYVSSTVDKSTYVTDDMSYTYIINRKDATTMTDLEMLQADFYNMLYNNLCMYGACTDQTMREQVTDNDYLNYALKNGQLFISSLNTDGYFYQGHYTANGHVGEVTDEEAVARAELEYNNIKSKLNYKEEKLELEMKNLDMEIASLSTEYDTVKDLVKKNIERSYKTFNA